MRDLSRLLSPQSIAVVGGGAWCRQVVEQSLAMGFEGAIFRVHPDPTPVCGIAAVQDLSQLPYPPDAVFLGINRRATLEAVKALSALGAGGAVCFASGFSEAVAEDEAGADLQAQLVAAAGDMPILGPNCYGFINALEGALLWPDQHGCVPVEEGVAILTQSSNIAINLTMQNRALPIAFVATCGNMAQTTQAEIALGLLDDPRITAIGLHIEGFGDTAMWHAFAQKADAKGVPVVALKVGASEHAQHATISHTASLAGSDAGAGALLRRLGIARVSDLPELLAALMLAHSGGWPQRNTLSSISCSGGEASLVADMAIGHDLQFPALTDAQRQDLGSALGPMVALSNPLDYHTYVWGDADKMTAAWLPMAAEHIGLVMIVLDYPRTDPRAWESATAAAIAVRRSSGRPVAVVATLPELLPPAVCEELLAASVVPLHGVREALAAFASLAARVPPAAVPPLPAGRSAPGVTLSEAEAKALLSAFGLSVPKGICVQGRDNLAAQSAALHAPLALKAQGIAHKTEAGGVVLGLDHDGLAAAAQAMPTDVFLVEEMAQDAVAEVLVGVTRDPAHGFVLTLAAGGVMTEVWGDSSCLLVPATRSDMRHALEQLRLYPLLRGFRGKEGVNLDAVLDAITAVQDCVVAQADEICEIEINPLICTAHRAIAVDALIVRAASPKEARKTT